MCNCAGRSESPYSGYASPPPPPPLGSAGLVLLHYIGERLEAPVKGALTRTPYPFDERAEVFVDQRDAVFLLGPDFTL